MDIEAIEKLADLPGALSLLTGVAYQHPQRALQVQVEKSTTANVPFELVFKNVGKEDFCVFDPRRLPGEPGDASAGVRIAVDLPDTPGFTAAPLDWTSIGLAPLPQKGEAKPTPLTLEPGEELRFPTLSWTPQAGESYIVQGLVSDYEAPPGLGDLPCIRGAAFSKALLLPSSK